MKSTTPDLAPLRTVEVTTKVVLTVDEHGSYDLSKRMGDMALEACLRGDTITFTPFQ